MEILKATTDKMGGVSVAYKVNNQIYHVGILAWNKAILGNTKDNTEFVNAVVTRAFLNKLKEKIQSRTQYKGAPNSYREEVAIHQGKLIIQSYSLTKGFTYIPIKNNERLDAIPDTEEGMEQLRHIAIQLDKKLYRSGMSIMENIDEIINNIGV